MNTVWIVVGAAMLVVIAADTFLAVLNYNERGLVVNHVARAVWIALRTVTRRLPRRLRQPALRQVTGIITVTVILSWLGGLILGFALIYFGAMGAGAIQVQRGAPEGFWAALYLSIGQFSTVGVENIASVHPVIDYLTVLEALSSVVMLSMIVTFLFNVFNGIQMLRSLCADVSRPTAGDRTPLAALYPFFPGGEASDVERYLTNTWGDLNLYGDVLRQTRTTYYFQSGDEQFSAPFALISISEIVAALRWGLPLGSNTVALSPGLFRMEESLKAARDWITAVMLKLPDADPPQPVTREEYAAQVTILRESQSPNAHAPNAGASQIDPLVREFFALRCAVARLVSATRSDEAARREPPTESYDRYLAWLPFGATSRRFNDALSADLDYQPLALADTHRPFDARGIAQPL